MGLVPFSPFIHGRGEAKKEKNMAANHKQCPQCRTIAALDARFCSQCGHQYRTVFTQPSDQTMAFGTPPPPQPTAASHYGPPNHEQPYFAQPYPTFGVEQKSKIAAGLLAFFLGGLGVHGFYLGNTSMGLTLLLVNIGAWITMFLGVIFSFLILPLLFVLLALLALGLIMVATLIQAILYWTASDADFHRKYVIEKRWF